MIGVCIYFDMYVGMSTSLYISKVFVSNRILQALKEYRNQTLVSSGNDRLITLY